MEDMLDEREIKCWRLLRHLSQRRRPHWPGATRCSVVKHIESVVLVQAQLQQARCGCWFGHRGEELSGGEVKENWLAERKGPRSNGIDAPPKARQLLPRGETRA